MLDRFHSKLHRYNHFTNYVTGYIDSATDPIAAPQDPFRGDFHVVGVLSATYVEGQGGVRIGNGTNRAFIVAPNLSAARTYTLPNSSGTVLLDSTITPYISSSQNQSGFIQSGTVWVDAVSGNDLTGVRERADKPFQTLGGAQTAAVAGDVVIVHPGTYIDSQIGKDGVNWYFELGAKAVLTTPTQSLFTYNSKSFDVRGFLNVTINGTPDPTLGFGIVADFGGSNGTSDLLFEFDRIVSNSTAVLSPTPTTGIFKGTFGSKNVVIRGKSIYAPKYNIFSAVKTLNPGAQSLTVQIDEYVIGQNAFYNSGHRLSTYVNTPIISASDYLYDDGTTNDAVDLFSLETGTAVGNFNRTTTTGPFYVDAVYFGINSRSSAVWNTSSTGGMHLFVDILSASIPMIVDSSTILDLHSFSINHTLSTQTFGISYTDTLVLVADTVTVVYPTTVPYSFLYTGNNDSLLNARIRHITNVSNGDFDILNINNLSGSKVYVQIDNAINGGDFHLYGGNNKVQLRVYNSTNSYLDIKSLSTSTENLVLFDGFVKTVSASNIRVEAVSGHSNSKLYIKGGTILQNAGTYTLDLSAVAGDPLNIFNTGTIFTNTSALDVTTNFTLQCGTFESASAIMAPVF